jgi:hypothetical protein
MPQKKLNPALDKAGFFFLNTLKTQNTLYRQRVSPAGIGNYAINKKQVAG